MNGEYWLLEQALSAQDTNAPVLIDIGANKGEWSNRALDLLSRHEVPGQVYAFEPASATFRFISQRFKTDRRLHPRQLALSDRSGEVEFFVVGELAGTNSVYETRGASVERIRSTYLDDLLREEGIDKVLFVKSDTEGHDLGVLRGACGALAAGKIDIWQFEYNHRWVFGNAMLKNVFDLVADKPYRVGKLYRNGIETFAEWHPELERYFETNYVLIRDGSPFERLCSSMRFDASNVAVPSEP